MEYVPLSEMIDDLYLNAKNLVKYLEKNGISSDDVFDITATALKLIEDRAEKIDQGKNQKENIVDAVVMILMWSVMKWQYVALSKVAKECGIPRDVVEAEALIETERLFDDNDT